MFPKNRLRRGLLNSVPWSLSCTSWAALLKFRMARSTPSPSTPRWAPRSASSVIAPDCRASRAERGAPTVISSRLPGTRSTLAVSMPGMRLERFHGKHAPGDRPDEAAEPALGRPGVTPALPPREAFNGQGAEPVLHQHLDTAYRL